MDSIDTNWGTFRFIICNLNFMNSIIGTNYLTPQGTGYRQVGAGVIYKNGFL